MPWYLPDFVTGHDEENYQAGLEADRKRQALNAAKHAERGDAWYSSTLENDKRSAGIADGSGRSPEEFISEGFSEGIDDGARDIRNGVGNAINAVALTPLKLIPWNLWLILGVVAFFYFGGIKLLTGRAKIK